MGLLEMRSTLDIRMLRYPRGVDSCLEPMVLRAYSCITDWLLYFANAMTSFTFVLFLWLS